MALESWLTKVKSAISSGLDAVRASADAAAPNRRKSGGVGILAFEVASLMSKLLHLWRSLSDSQLARLRGEVVAHPGVRRLVSDDDAYLLALARAELEEAVRAVSDAVAALSRRCSDPALRGFGQGFKKLFECEHDPCRWVMSWKEMESKARKMDRLVTSTATLYKEMDELEETEHAVKKLLLQCNQKTNKLPLSKIATVADLQQKLFWQRQQVKYLKQTSLWSYSFDAVVLLLARSAFTVLARIRHAFGGGGGGSGNDSYTSLPRASVSATIHPSADTSPPPCPPKAASGPLALLSSPEHDQCCVGDRQLSEIPDTAVLTPPPSTLGAAALAYHYANLIIVLEKMIRSPRAVGPEARDDLYAMLPASVRGQLRSRLRGLGAYWGVSVDGDAGLATEWRAAMASVVEWLLPMAQATLRWQADRSFERRSGGAAAVGTPRAGVLLLQTLHFASREKVEAAVTELLVGLNYVWRFERELAASAARAWMLQQRQQMEQQQQQKEQDHEQEQEQEQGPMNNS